MHETCKLQLLTGGRWRLQGELALSRSIGDPGYRRYGLIAQPFVSTSRQITGLDEMLLLATDGLFEGLSANEACSIAYKLAQGECLQLVTSDKIPQCFAFGHVCVTSISSSLSQSQHEQVS